MNYTADIQGIEKYCKDLKGRDSLRSLSFEALNLFLKEARESPPAPSIFQVIDDLSAIRKQGLEQCLGHNLIEKIEQDFLPALTIVSWNVNGLRSRIVDGKTSQKPPRKGKSFACRAVLADSPLGKLMRNPLIRADVLCLQETKLTANMHQIFGTTGFSQCGWTTFWSSSECANYSGVSTWVKDEIAGGAESRDSFDEQVLQLLPVAARDRLEKYIATRMSVGSKKLKSGDCYPLVNEGRLLITRLPAVKLVIVNTYSPNTGRAGSTSIASVRALARARESDPSLPSSVAFEVGPSNLSGGEKPEIIDVREDWDLAIAEQLKLIKTTLPPGWNLVWCGDMNVVREVSDLHRGVFTLPQAARRLR